MADYHRPYRSDLDLDLRPPPSSAPRSNGYFSSSSPAANAYFTPAPKGATAAADRRIEIYTTGPPPLPPPPRLALPPPPGRRDGGGLGGGGGAAGGGGGGGGMWCFSDPEMKRRRRVASYKAYSVEGKVKASLRRGLRWFKGKCSEIFHGW
ncbi:U1 small nuclear ribonucleoprotein C-like [Oryza brachyantha]|uniref:U1 small nuclear ribonucleoprotein C-like n=1 Tax=Oryza brachyantha TaxID=4533 RepID=UPI001ADD4CF4|nr:U1 small nuclear ribonucleoprotein C-like [Oryza brachyantha]